MMLLMTPASTSSGVAGLKHSAEGLYRGALAAHVLPLLVLLKLPLTDTAAAAAAAAEAAAAVADEGQDCSRRQ
jgi:hypothetical protein